MITVILGMHRSGTSALAGMLHSNGIIMGKGKDFYPPPMKENPKGFYENVRFRRVNDKILKGVGYSVKSFDPIIPEVPIVEDVDLRSTMKKLIREYDKDCPSWGWKDPRTSLTMASWYDVMKEMGVEEDLRVVIILRPSSEVAKSMRARGNKEKYSGQFSKLAIEYVSRAVGFMSSNQEIQTTTFQFKALLYDTKEVVNRLEHLIEAKITDTSFVDPMITRSVA